MQGAGALEAQIAPLEQAIHAAEAALFSRESELLDLRVELVYLERQYETRIGSKLAELEAVAAEIKACQEQLDEYRIWGRRGAQLFFGAQYVSVGEQYRQAQQETSGFSFSSFAEQLVDRPLSPEDEAQLKTLYRQLCKRFHPDLAQDEADQVCRTEMMAKINDAYTAHDLPALESLSAQPDCEASMDDAFSEVEAAEQRLASLRDTLQRIQQRLETIDQEFDELVHSDLMELRVEVKLAGQQGRDVWAEMEADVEKELAEKRAELAALKAQLRVFESG